MTKVPSQMHFRKNSCIDHVPSHAQPRHHSVVSEQPIMRILIVTTRHVGDITSGADLRLFAHLRPMLRRHEFSLLHAAQCAPIPSEFRIDLTEFFGDRIVEHVDTGKDWRKFLRPPGPMAIAAHPFAWRRAVSAAVERFAPDVLQVDMLQACLVTPPTLRKKALAFGQDSFRRFSATRSSTEANRIKRFVFTVDALAYAFYERVYKFFGASAFLSRDDINAAGSPDNAVLVENGVHLMPPDDLPDQPTIFFGGNLQYLPNREGVFYFIREVFPALANAIPDLRVIIAGRSPAPDLLDLANDQIEIVANPPDLVALLKSARVAICPVKWGAGQKNKILEAAAAGRPIVADPHMIEGSEFVAGTHVLTASTHSDWIEKISRLLQSSEEAERLRTAARELVVKRYSWETSSAIVEGCYARLASGHAVR